MLLPHLLTSRPDPSLAIAGTAWAVLLIILQGVVIGAWCKLCMIADPAALGYAIAVLAGATALRFTPVRGFVTLPALLATVGILALWTGNFPAAGAQGVEPAPATAPGIPAFVAQAQVPGTATVVEVVDFECPFCRRMQDRLVSAIAQVRHPVRVVRKMMPLKIHPHAMPAALAYCCADAQGKGDEMAAALFAAKPDDLTPEGCEKIAASVGCDLERYRRDLPQSEARVAAEMKDDPRIFKGELGRRLCPGVDWATTACSSSAVRSSADLLAPTICSWPMNSVGKESSPPKSS